MADDEQFSLCWNNFNSNLSAGFHESLCRGDLVDVTLAAEGQFVKAHRLVLSVCSPYFRKMFTQMPANQHAFVFLKDVSHSALKDLIQFMYCGEVNVKQEALPAFISTAEALQIKGLTDGDPAPSQSPAKPSTPAPQPVQPAQTITTQTLSSPRVRQRSSTSRTYRIETDDSDDKSPQIVLQTTTVSQQTQPTIVQSSTTTTVNASQKRVAPRSITAPQSKRVKNVTDPLEAAEPTQISVQTVSENKATNETEFIDLPIEIPTKSEPDYAEEAGEVETAEQDATYVEDDTYADMKYDESYFTENEEGGTTSGGAGTATTSTAVVKQSFVDNSYVEQSEQSAGEAQDKYFEGYLEKRIKSEGYSDKKIEDQSIEAHWVERKDKSDKDWKEDGSSPTQDDIVLNFIPGQRGKSLLYFNGFTFARNNECGDTVYWCCRSRKIGSPACKARITTSKQENGSYKVVVTKPHHNHGPTVRMLKKIEKCLKT